MEPAKPNPATSVSGWRKLAVGWLTMFVVGSDLFVVSPLLPLIAADYAVPTTSAALSVTVFAFSYMLSAPLLGRVADRSGCERVLIYCLGGFAAANLLSAVAGNLTWLLAARIVAGTAAAGVSPSTYALIGASAPPERRATWLAIVVSGLLMSLALGAPAGLLAAAAAGGWATVFAGLGGLSMLLLWANSRVWPNQRHSERAAIGSNRLKAAAVAARLAPTVTWSMAVYGMYTYLAAGLISHGYATAQIAEAILCYGCGAISGVLLGGRMADRLGARMTSAIGLASLCLGILLLRFALEAGVLVDCAFAFASLAGQLFFPAQQLRLANEFPGNRAAVLAWNNSALFFGITLGSIVGGRALLLGGYDLDLTVSAATAILAWTINLIGYLPRALVITAHPAPPSGTQGAR
jgi:predicted MFS family arabinose efflux permease